MKCKNNSDTDREEIRSFLTCKIKYFERILDLSGKQVEAIQANNTNKLTAITRSKENCIKEIKQLDKQNLKILEELKGNYKSLVLGEKLTPLLKQLHIMITKIRNYDLDSISFLHTSIKKTEIRLNRLHKNRARSVRYQGIHPSRYIDVIQ